MATYYSDQYQSRGGVSVASLPAGFVHRMAAKFTITTALAQDDVVKMLRLPAGATVVEGRLKATDIDTGTEALDIDIGWAANGVDSADPDGYGNLGVWTGDSNNDFAFQNDLWSNGPRTFTVATDIQLDVNAAANAGGTGTIWMIIDYYM
jgi:hypothetical protein